MTVFLCHPVVGNNQT